MRQVLPIAGAIVGAYFGNPQLGFAIGSLIGNVVDPQEIQGSKVGDNPMQTASEGGARAIVFGTGCVRATCLLERGNRQIVEVEDQAGKGGPVTVNERVYWTFAIGLGEAIPGGAIVRIWEGEKLVYDASPGSPIPAETAEFARKFRFYDGSEDQLPDPALEAINGVGNTHYYRGTAYVVFPNYDLTDYREQIPVYRWEIASVAETGVPTRIVAGRVVNGLLQSTTSADGSSWSSWGGVPSDSYPQFTAASSTSLVGWSTTEGKISYYDTQDLQWKVSSGVALGTSGVTKLGWADGQVVGIPHATVNGIAVSTDGGKSFSSVIAAVGASVLMKIGARWVALELSERKVYTGLSISDLTLAGVYAPGLIFAAEAHHAFAGTGIVVGRVFGGGIAAISVTPTGDVTGESLPSLGSATDVTCISGAMLNGGPTWIVGTNTGNTAIRDATGTWAAGPSFGATCIGATWDGINFYMIGSSVSGGVTTGYIKRLNSSMDGWETVLTGTHDTTNAAWGPITAFSAGQHSAIGEPIPLASILTALHRRAGHSADDFDVSECPELVTGLVFESSLTFAEAINSVIGSYFKDPSEYDRKIHYVSRGKPVVRTLTEDDLVDEPESSRRENAIEYPRKLHYFFQSPITHYAATKATSARSSPDVHVIGEVSVSSPITYDNPDEPAQVSAKLHKVYWADAEGEIVWHVTDEHADLVPGDCVGLNLRGVVRRARITSIGDDPGVRKLTMRIDRQSAYTSNVTGIPLPPPTPPRPSIIAPSIGLTLDIPALTDDTDDLHYLRAITGLTDVWAGAVDQRSMDDGASFASINTTSRAAVIGVLQDTVTAASPHFTDTTNLVAVELFVDRDLESISQQQFLSEGGAFALSYMDGDERKWELCQYRGAEQDSDGNWILSTLHRGRLNTAAAAHAPGDFFVLLGRGLLKNSAQTAWIGQELVHRAVSNGLTPETAATETTNYTGQSQREFPVAHVQLELTGDDLSVSVVPRHRFGTDDNPVRSLNWTGYRILATDGANSATYETTSDSTEINVAGWSGTIDVTVAQINRITGAGPTVTESTPA